MFWYCHLGAAALVLPPWFCHLGIAALILLTWSCCLALVFGLVLVCAICLSSRQVFLAVIGWHLLCECVLSSVYTTSILWFNRLYTLSSLIFLVVPDPGAL